MHNIMQEVKKKDIINKEMKERQRKRVIEESITSVGVF